MIQTSGELSTSDQQIIVDAIASFAAIVSVGSSIDITVHNRQFAQETAKNAAMLKSILENVEVAVKSQKKSFSVQSKSGELWLELRELNSAKHQLFLLARSTSIETDKAFSLQNTLNLDPSPNNSDVSHGSWRFNHESKMLHLTEGAHSILRGLPSRAVDLSLSSFLKIYSVDILGSNVKALANGLQHGATTWSAVCLIADKKNGQEKYIAASGTSLTKRDDLPEFSKGLIIDITGSEYFAAKRFKPPPQREELQQMASKLAHEVSNMLQPALSYADTALDELKHGNFEQAKDSLQHAIEATQRVGSVVQEVVYDQAAANTELEVITVSELVEDIRKFCKPREGLQLVVDLKHGVRDLLIKVSRTGFSQVLLNLVGNAFDSGGEKSKVFVLINESRNRLSQRRMLIIDVLDQGGGFSQEALSNAFRMHYTTKAEDKGSGLGLSMVRTMVERWGGNVHLANIGTQGALVRVTFPIVE